MAIRNLRGFDLWKEIKKEGFPSDMNILHIKNRRIECKKLKIKFLRDVGNSWEEGNYLVHEIFFDFGKYRYMVRYKEFPSKKIFTCWETLHAYNFRLEESTYNKI